MAQASFIEVQKALSGVDYPATKQQLIEHAKKNKAGKQAMEALQGLPDKEYDGPNKVSQAVAKES
ncbi:MULTISPECIES: DUF2795 domain-containing protein [Thermomonospora]|uniref:DUF2795 domain-containing protein n=1 Tax=Thermomonospora cellulosilytica TaxID=1411118 RepID=A0A7W3MWC9_9ACTN|nr:MULTISPECIES: DUF2795 domain-containing protein [Thermomonospora]MBA9003111.1 hypothetical protein [Thermomonospora cellulosilytica]